MRITNISYSNLVCQGFKASLPWSARLSWLGDPRIYTPVKQTYRLESGREFPCADVLNHRVFERGKLMPRDSWEGILLAHSMFGRIPFDYPHGSTVPAELAIVDQHGREHASSIEISVDRTATMRPLMLTRPRKGLYDRSTPEQRTVDPESVRPTNSALTGTLTREIVAGNEQLSRASTVSDQRSMPEGILRKKAKKS